VSPSEEFLALVAGAEETIELDHGCLLIAAVGAGGGTDLVPAGRRQLDDLAAGCPGDDLESLRAHLFGTVGFAGNRLDYEDPRNSYLDAVLERRTGIPITLSVVVIEVGRRLGLRLDPVGMPGHFLVGAGGGRYVDAFDKGRILDEHACRRRFHELAGPGAPWTPDLLVPVGTHVVLARVLGNLRRLFADRRDLNALDWVLRLRTAIPGVSERERAERADVLAALGRYGEAANELDRLAAAEEQASGGGTRHPSQGPVRSGSELGADLRARAARLRARLN
jgi:regulator of sirC expression with transglutaminase-like and TPR domain